MADVTRPLLDASRIAAPAQQKMAGFHASVVDEVRRAIEANRVVVVGMAQNPHVKNVRKLLSDEGIAFTYLEYGSYVSKWKERLAVKLWSGWPTFPQVFVRGTLVGGEDLTRAALSDGSLRKMLEG